MRFDNEATGIGSVPFKDPRVSCELIFEHFPAIPFWPQLPKRSFLEHMYVQYSEGMPGIVIDEKKKTVHVDATRALTELEGIYAKFLEGDTSFFKVSEDYAEGFYVFSDSFTRSSRAPKCVKGHITGPISLALGITDEKKRSIIHDKDIFEGITKVLAMKARWQARELKRLCENVIIFIDEPYLVSIGSSYVTINIGEAFQALDEVIAAIHEEGALAGIHCCGNTDWQLILKREIDIVNFDAYNFVKEFSLYAKDVDAFLKKGGTIAWGIIPSSDEVRKESPQTLQKRLKDARRLLVAKGVTDDMSSIITPSCGAGTLSEDAARTIFTLAAALSGKG